MRACSAWPGRLAGQRLAITFVTVGELTRWTYLHRWGRQRRAGLQAFFGSVIVLPGSFPHSDDLGARSRSRAIRTSAHWPRTWTIRDPAGVLYVRPPPDGG
jgi:hypothetical protein